MNSREEIKIELQRILETAEIPADEKGIDLSVEMLSFLLFECKTQNFVSVKNNLEMLHKHFLDSVMLMKFIRLNDERIMDLGTGAGFPGIPLKIFNEKTQMHLLDSVRKKINQVKYIIGRLNLHKTYPLHGRAEEIAKDTNHREKYDLVVVRAVAEIKTLKQLAWPFLKEDGKLILYKGPSFKEEIEEAEKHSEIKIKEIKKYQLPGGEKRFLLFICKNNLQKQQK